MKRILLAIAATILTIGAANAQSTLAPYQKGPRLIDGSQLNKMVNTVNGLIGKGTIGNVSASKITTNSAVPTLSSCGTSPSVVGSNVAGRLVTGSAATTCTITFATAYTNAPFCTVTAEVATQPTYTVSATAITFATSIASTAYQYHCIAANGG
jgi:hypothetical protein